MSLFKEDTIIRTARYDYGGGDRLDITVKGDDDTGKILAPTWEMVRGVKNGTMSHNEYTKRYTDILFNVPDGYVTELLKRSSITLVCFCKPYTFCHRYLAAIFLDIKGGVYMGEVQ